MKQIYSRLGKTKFLLKYFEPAALLCIILGMLVNIMKTPTGSVAMIDFVLKGDLTHNAQGLCDRDTASGAIIAFCLIALILSFLPKIRQLRHIFSMFTALYSGLDVLIVGVVLSSRAVLQVSLLPWFYIYVAFCAIVAGVSVMLIVGDNFKRAEKVNELAEDLKSQIK